MTRKVMAIGSLKGAPGASTLALALTAVWPEVLGGEPAVLVEADVSGGDLAARFGLSDADGLMALAAGARWSAADGGLEGFIQELPGGIRVITAPTGDDQASASVGEVAARPSVLRGDADTPGTAVLDLGRLHSEPSRKLAQTADRLLLVARGGIDALAHIAARGEWLAGTGPELVVVGPCHYSNADIGNALEFEADRVHLVPWDPRAGDALAGRGRIGEWRWRRSPLALAAGVLARSVAGLADDAGSGLKGVLAQLAKHPVPTAPNGQGDTPLVMPRGEAQ